MDEIVVERRPPSKSVVAINTDERPQESPSADSSSLTPSGSTLSKDESLGTRGIGVYNDVMPPSTTFWIEVNPKSQFDRDEFELDEEEFDVVGIVGEVGEGDDLQYEVQFEDDHTATVVSLSIMLILASSE